MAKKYTLTGAQLRCVVKEAFFAGFDAARFSVKADMWEESTTRKEIDYHGLFERLEQSAKDVPTE